MTFLVYNPKYITLHRQVEKYVCFSKTSPKFKLFLQELKDKRIDYICVTVQTSTHVYTSFADDLVLDDLPVKYVVKYKILPSNKNDDDIFVLILKPHIDLRLEPFKWEKKLLGDNLMKLKKKILVFFLIIRHKFIYHVNDTLDLTQPLFRHSSNKDIDLKWYFHVMPRTMEENENEKYIFFLGLCLLVVILIFILALFLCLYIWCKQWWSSL